MATAPPSLGGGWLGRYGQGRTVSRAFLMGEGYSPGDLGPQSRQLPDRRFAARATW